MKAFVFPGQGAQFSGMGKDLYDAYPEARTMMQRANEVLGFNLTEVMFEGTDEALRQTRVTQPAIFLHSIVAARLMTTLRPDMVAGHSLGEFSALAANGTIQYEDGLRLVAARANAMQAACEENPGTMAAIIGMDNEKIESICASIKDEVVIPANYNCNGQVVISGSIKGVEMACQLLKEAGAKRALPLQVGGAFHSPLMEPARVKLAEAIQHTKFTNGICPIYQNVTGQAVASPDIIKANLISQLTSPVRWTQTMGNMLATGLTEVIEVGPGTVLQGLFKKAGNELKLSSAEI